MTASTPRPASECAYQVLRRIKTMAAVGIFAGGVHIRFVN
jgi:hypothetical protein